MSHYTITLGFEADNEAEAMELAKAISNEIGKVIRSFNRYEGDPEDQDTKAVKEYNPEEKIDHLAKFLEEYNNE